MCGRRVCAKSACSFWYGVFVLPAPNRSGGATDVGMRQIEQIWGWRQDAPNRSGVPQLKLFMIWASFKRRQLMRASSCLARSLSS